MDKIVFSPEARQDIREVLDFIARENPQAADKVLSEVFATLNVLVLNPKAGRLHPFKNHALVDIYSYVLRQFNNYVIFYRVRAGVVEVVRLLHGARDIDALFE